ncbi:hypothetical protein GJ744_002240 [Endocarpon pusillum]|uniref:C3H1-type domain-containing protein n=1 Tax=Endocarpon pusillum TaxID=364733 RepID=A0A8H7AC66_9EURO|nr:hypothetical protein GJ744_002240 [Endocarpon pusillum]
MVVCRYYQQGNCRFGDNCKYEHPGSQNSRNTGFASQNRFSAFQSPVSGGGKDVKKDVPWQHITVEVENDLTPGKGRPGWILSTYGPAKNAPASLFDGNELSFEELRLRFYELKADGNEMQATNEASSLWSKAEQQISDVLHNLNQVVRFMEDAEKKHPNRYDLLKMTGTIPIEQALKEAGSKSPLGGASAAQLLGFGSTGSGFGSAFSNPGMTSNTSSGFDAPKLSDASSGVFGKSTSSTSFGAPSFGQPSRPTFGQSGFGQLSTASALGRSSGGTFGQPSNPAQPAQTSSFGTLGFGQPATKNPFAAPSAAAFGQSSKPVSGFGQTSQVGSGFGQPSQLGGLGQTSQPTPGFGQASQLGSRFGQPSKPAGFGSPTQPSSGFRQPSQPAPAFGQPSNPFSTFGKPSQPAAAFAQSSQRTSSFGQPIQPASGFGQAAQSASTFGQPSQPTSTFGQPAQPAFGFGQPSQTSTANQAGPAFGQSLPSQLTDKRSSNPFGNRNSSITAFSQPSEPSPNNTMDRPNPFATSSSTTPTLVNSPTPPPQSTAPVPATVNPGTTTVTTPHPNLPTPCTNSLYSNPSSRAHPG